LALVENDKASLQVKQQEHVCRISQLEEQLREAHKGIEKIFIF
jgi:hypothetical protein